VRSVVSVPSSRWWNIPTRRDARGARGGSCPGACGDVRQGTTTTHPLPCPNLAPPAPAQPRAVRMRALICNSNAKQDEPDYTTPRTQLPKAWILDHGPQA